MTSLVLVINTKACGSACLMASCKRIPCFILRRQDNRLVGVFIQAFRMVDGRSAMEGDGNKVVNLLRFVSNDGKGLIGVHVLQEKVNRKERITRPTIENNPVVGPKATKVITVIKKSTTNNAFPM